MKDIVSNLIVIKNGRQQQLSVLKENSNQTIQELLKTGSIVIEDEYTPILNNGEYNYSDNIKNLKIYIPESIDIVSIPVSYEIIKNIEKNPNFINRFIYNYRKDDYDYYDERQAKLNKIYDDIIDELKDKVDNSKIQELISCIKNGIDVDENKNELLSIINEEKNVSNIFLYYTKEKVDLLSSKGKEMLQVYRSFNLEKLLTSYEYIKYPLNNGGAGCISIFEDDMISSPITKMQHSEETRYHLKKRGLGYISDISKSYIEFNVIEIQLYKNTLIIYTPDNLNEYQKEQLLSILNQVKQIEVNCQEKIDVNLDKYQQEENYSTDVDDVIEFVEKIEVKVNSK